MEKSDGYKKLSGSSKKWDGGGGPYGGGPYGGGPGRPPRGLDNVRGIDHSMLLPILFPVVILFTYKLQYRWYLVFNNLYG